jgi:iron(II)-dependent oxidoreductase
MNEMAAEIAELMTEARADTLAIFDLAREEDLHVSPGFGFRPIIWHLAHIGVFEGYWLLQKMQGLESVDPYYDRIFDPINTPREASINLPSRQQMESYLNTVRGESLRYLERANMEGGNPLLKNGYIFDLVLQHEYQHQETLVYLFQMLDPDRKIRPDKLRRKINSTAVEKGMIFVPGGEFEMGARTDLFVYDNELPPQFVYVAPYMIDRTPVTNEEYAGFVEERGYERREFWSDEGWTWREKENWTQPLYWSGGGPDWMVRAMFEDAPMKPRDPVSGISWYEAEAYAKFVSKRLPSEAEWEIAAAWDPAEGVKRRFAWGNELPDDNRSNFGVRQWSTSPAGILPEGASYYGCFDMTGNVWEWTSDAFDGYPGFESFPYPEYSELWFDGDHRVLKGGSWATRTPLLRTSFRNFFRRHFRIAFAGLRCAADA